MEDEHSSTTRTRSRIPMAKTARLLRRSVYTFLQKYQSFTTTAAFLAFPFAALVLVSESAIPTSSILHGIHTRLRSLFDASGFPTTSAFFTILNLKLSQTIATSYLVFPFTFTFFLMAKAFVIHSFSSREKPRSESPFAFFNTLYSPLFTTQICNTLIIISVNATCFCILLLAFNFCDALGLVNPRALLIFSATGAVLYSIVLANALIICNMALVLSGMENCSGFIAILKACVMIKGRTATALSLAIPVSMALAGVEALFQYRVVRAYHSHGSPFSAMVFEGMFIAYLYAILLVLDTVIGCIFYRSCVDHLQEEQQVYCQIEFEGKWKRLEDLP